MLIVAIDGPSGVGKSTTSKLVATELQIPHIDTGAMYRAVALKAVSEEMDFNDEEGLAELASRMVIEFRVEGDRLAVYTDGRDVTEEIRQPAMSMAASTVSAVPAVRRVLVQKQQELGRRSGGVLEGRDIGTKVFPETPYKFYLTAQPEVRAGRRHTQLAGKGASETYDQVLAEQAARDTQDSTRADSPLTWDQTYTVIDTSGLSIDEVVRKIVSAVRRG